MTIRVGKRQRPEPDLVVIRADAVTSLDQTWFPVEAVVLAVEVVSPDSAERDRHRKPELYAKAGIKHFWRLEETEGVGPVLYVFELEPVSKTYAVTGIHRDLVRLTVPYEIEIDLTEIYRL
jgi:Uma2 family endonuclease